MLSPNKAQISLDKTSKPKCESLIITPKGPPAFLAIKYVKTACAAGKEIKMGRALFIQSVTARQMRWFKNAEFNMGV